VTRRDGTWQWRPGAIALLVVAMVLGGMAGNRFVGDDDARPGGRIVASAKASIATLPVPAPPVARASAAARTDDEVARDDETAAPEVTEQVEPEAEIQPESDGADVAVAFEPAAAGGTNALFGSDATGPAEWGGPALPVMISGPAQADGMDGLQPGDRYWFGPQGLVKLQGTEAQP
jgi:hypothetical protein